jgi:predicted nucleotidyltransferase
MVQLDNGLDEHGYIRNVYSPSHIQAEFKAVVDAAVNELTTKFPNQIDGIYLYGSIGRGNAVLGKSDLDLSIVLKHPQSDTQRQTFKMMVRDFPRCNAQVSKIDLDIGHVNEVLQVDEYYRWQFWLKHCCCCVWGNDLSKQFESQKPSHNIAMALNGDLIEFIEKMIPKLSSGTEHGIEKVIGKKLLRTAYYFVAERDLSWYSNLEQCLEACIRHYPNHVEEFGRIYDVATGNPIPPNDALHLFEWLSEFLNHKWMP